MGTCTFIKIYRFYLACLLSPNRRWTHVLNNYIIFSRFQSSKAINGKRLFMNYAFSLHCSASRELSGQSANNQLTNTPIVENLILTMYSCFERNGYVQYEMFCRALDILEQHPDIPKSLLVDEQLKFLVNVCANGMPAQTPEHRMHVFERLWQYLKENNLLCGTHYMSSLKVRAANRYPLLNVREFINEAKNCNKSVVDVKFYEQLVLTACENGNLCQAKDIVTEMRQRQYELSEQVFNALIVCHGWCGDVSACNNVVDSMIASGHVTNVNTQTVLVCAYIRCGQPLNQIIALLDKYQGLFNDGQVLQMLRTALNTGAARELILRLLMELPPDYLNVQDLPIQMRNICIELISKGQLDELVHFVKLLPQPEFNEGQDTDTYCAFLLCELFRARVDAAKMIEIARMLVDTGKNTRALHIACEMCLRKGQSTAPLFLKALKDLEPLRPHYFWPLILQGYRRHAQIEVVDTLKHMMALGVDCDAETLTAYVIPHLSLTLLKSAAAVEILNAVGLKTTQIMRPLLVNLIAQQKIDEATELVRLYASKVNTITLVQPLRDLYINSRHTKLCRKFAELIEALCQKAEKPKVDFVGCLLLEILGKLSSSSTGFDVVHYFIFEMHSLGLKVSKAASELISGELELRLNPAALKTSKRLLEEMCHTSLLLPDALEVGESLLTLQKHPREMSCHELECHLVELEAKGMNTRGVLRRLLQVCVREGKLQRADDIRRKCDEEKVAVSAGMLASIFDLYVKRNDLNKAETFFGQLRTRYPAFTIDEHKIIDYASLMVQNGQLEAGKHMLAARAKSCRIVGGDYIVKNIWTLLSHVAHFAAQKEEHRGANCTKDTFLLLQRLGYCDSRNAILGPIIREHLLRHDIRAAVEEFEELFMEYKHTPLQFELMSLLIRLGNSTELQESWQSLKPHEAKQMLTKVTDIIAQVHGGVNMNTSLLLAFAESGTEHQLRSMLLNTEVRINQQMLVRNCDHLNKGGAIQTLFRLARACRGLRHAINEQSVYNLLLMKYAKTNDFNAALDLYNHLETDDEFTLSQDFLKNLVNLLKMNNIEIPHNVALRTHVL